MKRVKKIANDIAMKIYLGEKGLDKSWQKDFSPTTECVHCAGEARIAFVGMEDGEGDFITQLHKNEGKGGFWPHDAVAIAVYLCRDCLEPTSKYNQV